MKYFEVPRPPEFYTIGSKRRNTPLRHFILSCPLYTNQRNQLFCELNQTLHYDLLQISKNNQQAVFTEQTWTAVIICRWLHPFKNSLRIPTVLVPDPNPMANPNPWSYQITPGECPGWGVRRPRGCPVHCTMVAGFDVAAVAAKINTVLYLYLYL